eukprot:scaffold21871_cov64-Phaeocystis_antarctica.AAC.9
MAFASSSFRHALPMLGPREMGEMGSSGKPKLSWESRVSPREYAGSSVGSRLETGRLLLDIGAPSNVPRQAKAEFGGGGTQRTDLVIGEFDKTMF